ncbi:helix-turn-helix domain-containing protein, partial [Streptomyces werraensis]|uniref:helix-turn-helix domain-containing protein n=1 Tax=Streptomyces werraensis TaxID=68284 RepID=UPI003801E960
MGTEHLRTVLSRCWCTSTPPPLSSRTLFRTVEYPNLPITADTVRTWRRRFLERGLDSLSDEPRPGVPRKITDADVERVIVKTLEEKPKNATHWSTRSMAAATGMSQSAISRIRVRCGMNGTRPGLRPGRGSAPWARVRST